MYEARDKTTGSRRLAFTPAAFIARLARLVPPPRKNIVRCFGALAPNSPLRPLVAQAAREASKASPIAALKEAVVEAAASTLASAKAWAIGESPGSPQPADRVPKARSRARSARARLRGIPYGTRPAPVRRHRSGPARRHTST